MISSLYYMLAMLIMVCVVNADGNMLGVCAYY
jgi:hypothetical protein